MPYRPFRNQSRVEFIRKKFESSFTEGGDTESVKLTKPSISNKSNFLQGTTVPNSDKKAVNLEIESGLKNSYVNKNEGKALVKRSPAFRREKLGCSKSLTHYCPQESVTLKKLECKNNNENAQGGMPKSIDDVNVNTCNDFKRSKTDTNLLKYCSSKNKDKEFSPDNSKDSEISNSFSRNEDSESQTEQKISAQYSVVNKKRNNAGGVETVNLTFSESIRRALQSPLPKGPPPKKPPRTFCHIPLTQANAQPNNCKKPSVSTKADIPKLKSKLEKLEKVVKIRETGNKEDKKKNDIEKQVNKIPKIAENCLADSYQACLPISHCLSQGSKVQNFKKLSKAKSEFHIQLNSSDLKVFESFGRRKETSIGSASDDVPLKKSTAEAIYDLPCVNKKSSFETFGKCSKDVKESVNSIKVESLHYMCTDVINQAAKHPNFLSEAMEGENKNGIFACKPNCLTDIQKHKSSSMTRIDSANEHVHDLKIGKGDEKKKKLREVKEFLCSTALEESNSEPETDLLVSSDCNEGKNTSRAEEEILSQMAARRKIYVSRVSSKLINQTPSWKFKSKNSYKHLFECCLLVGLTLCESKQNVPYIKNVFPPDTKPPPLIESLCFPDASYWPPTSESHQHEEQYYSLVVTNENGERKFGYCRRVLPEGGHVCLPLAYCIISPHRAAGFFYKVLEELESRHGSSGLDKFIKQLYESEFPGPGERLKLKEILEEVTRTTRTDSDMYISSTLVRRPPDVRLEEKDLTQLFKHLQLPVFLKVFSSLLHERKVLLLSNSLRKLSSCIEALQSILLPFSWQHTYIPVLPDHLIEMCEAPTPFVIGLLKPRNVEKSLTNVNFEDGILVDLDDSKIVKCCGDEGSILPSRFIKDLKTALNLAMTSTDLLSESVRNVLISDAFIRFFVQVCGKYSNFIQTLPNGEKIFQKEEFVKSANSNTAQSFLDWFTETAMFNSFIQERLQGEDEGKHPNILWSQHDTWKSVLVKLFRRRAIEYSEETVKDSTILLKNYKVINKKVRTLGDKIKDFTSFTK